ncbi:MAG: class I SAM-dependent methyltransferase [Candidatus Dormiibacterota bacterium]
MSIADASRGRPILDLGVGTGRTTSLLLLLSDDYAGLDYSLTMVERAQQAHPDVDIRVGDARDLSAYPTAHYSLIMFSCNGIDCVNHRDRIMVFTQVRGALAPGGHFVYATLNKRWPWFNEPPWRTDSTLTLSRPERAVRLAGQVLLRNREYRRRWTAWLRLRKQVRDFGDWGIGPLGGPGSGLVVHWTTPAATGRELHEAGLAVVSMFNSDGSRIGAEHEDAASGTFHVVAERPS